MPKLDTATPTPVSTQLSRPTLSRRIPDPKLPIKTRQAFDIYADQFDSLKKLSLKPQLQGEKGSMSATVRDALDDYLKKQGKATKFVDILDLRKIRQFKPVSWISPELFLVFP